MVGPQGGLTDREIIQVFLAKLSKQKTHGLWREKAKGRNERGNI